MYRIEKIWQTEAGLTAVCAVMQGEYRDPSKPDGEPRIYDKHRCGYVAVSRKHKAWGADYQDINVSAHGSLTYASTHDEARKYPVQHENAWWFGFDTAHSFDKPIEDPYHFMKGIWDFGGTTKSLDFIVAECEKMAVQLMSPELEVKKYLGYTEGRWELLKGRIWNATVGLRWCWRWIRG